VTAEAMRTYRAVVWQRHGIVTRAPSIAKAADLVEYAEAAAQYEYLNLVAGEPSQGLSDEEIRRIAARYGVDQKVF
jgi:rhamnulose-1-phosphate aldolase